MQSRVLTSRFRWPVPIRIRRISRRVLLTTAVTFLRSVLLDLHRPHSGIIAYGAQSLMAEILIRRRNLLETLAHVSIADLADHECPHCLGIVIDTKTAHRAQKLLYNVDQALHAAADGCTWYGWLMNQIRQSGTTAQDMGRHRFTLEFSYKDRDFGGLNSYDVHAIDVFVGTESYGWRCAHFDVYAEAGRALFDRCPGDLR